MTSVGEIASCTWPGPGRPSSPNDASGKIRSPARTSPGATGTPSWIWAEVSPPSCTPALPQLHCVKPEQSKELGPLAPPPYGLPRRLNAASTAVPPGPAGTSPALPRCLVRAAVRGCWPPAVSPDLPDRVGSDNGG